MSKAYISAGLGDVCRVDSILTQEERNNITEIYWGCRFGHCAAPLMENNPFYPNLVKQHFIDDEVGQKEMKRLYGKFETWWHFRPDIPLNYQTGLSLFGLNESEVTPIDVMGMFNDPNRVFRHSSFLDNAKECDVEGLVSKGYVLVHYPTSSRPREGIAKFTDKDWNFVRKLSEENSLNVVVITDTEIQIDLPNSTILLNPSIKTVVALCKFAAFFVGCDSFCSILCAKTNIPASNMFVKIYFEGIEKKVLDYLSYFGYFQPHSKESVAKFCYTELTTFPINWVFSNGAFFLFGDNSLNLG